MIITYHNNYIKIYYSDVNQYIKIAPNVQLTYGQAQALKPKG